MNWIMTECWIPKKYYNWFPTIVFLVAFGFCFFNQSATTVTLISLLFMYSGTIFVVRMKGVPHQKTHNPNYRRR